MKLFPRLRPWFGKRPTARPAAPRQPRRPHLRMEYLEDRTLFAANAVSLAATPLLSDTAAGNVQGPGSVSSNGRYVVYTDTAANLAAGQVMNSETSSSVFLFDRSTGKTTLVSHAYNNTATTADGTSKNAAISADGNWVAFVSNSDNLIANETLPNDQYTLLIQGYSGGYFTLKYGGQATGQINYTGLNAAAIQS